MPEQKPRVTEFVIDRTLWYRGQSGADSRLRRSEDGKMCCLGFYTKACGYTDEEITQKPFPSALEVIKPEIAWLTETNAKHMNMEYVIGVDNDKVATWYNLAEEEREHRITAHFAAQGITVTFIK